MKERPILFSTEMVQAIIAGRKTQTRRVVKDKCTVYNNRETCMHLEGNIWKWLSETGHGSGIRYDNCFKCPYGKVGDVLWVREGFFEAKDDAGGKSVFIYKSDSNNPSRFRWKPSIQMPKDACRIWLRITNVRVERLQDISEEDSIKEGIQGVYRTPPKGNNDCWRFYGTGGGTDFPLKSFQSLWQSINGEQSWNDNPFVWVIEFERIFKN